MVCGSGYGSLLIAYCKLWGNSARCVIYLAGGSYSPEGGSFTTGLGIIRNRCHLKEFSGGGRVYPEFTVTGVCSLACSQLSQMQFSSAAYLIHLVDCPSKLWWAAFSSPPLISVSILHLVSVVNSL